MNVKFPKTYCVFDFETSGLDPLKNSILEIGALRVEEGKEPVEFSVLIKWPGLVVPEEISKLTGITQEMIDKEGVDPETALKNFYEFTLTESGQIAPLVGHNGFKFDIPFWLATGVFNSWEGYQIDRWIWNNFIDTAAIYKAIEMGEPDIYWNESLGGFFNRILEARIKGLRFNVAACCEKLKINREGVKQHRALADVLLTNEIYKKICLTK